MRVERGGAWYEREKRACLCEASCHGVSSRTLALTRRRLPDDTTQLTDASISRFDHPSIPSPNPAAHTPTRLFSTFLLTACLLYYRLVYRFARTVCSLATLVLISGVRREGKEGPKYNDMKAIYCPLAGYEAISSCSQKKNSNCPFRSVDI